MQPAEISNSMRFWQTPVINQGRQIRALEPRLWKDTWSSGRHAVHRDRARDGGQLPALHGLRLR
jgi:hypothetical protein